ncbi:MAG: inner membrane CreD family protein [candidate division Zixibacteria bacterium]|nr:inner membrane CreD family protein [candidate division Zixibacteria bacterium]MDH3935871.1 inner membrane CreD family protein [candidate division Zixibacteria bacterium]MDH4032901.1 inner membrane CreD family protein [candidate division Zixibacteria bacterium]
MSKRILPLVVIFIFASVAWVTLGSSMELRTDRQDAKLKAAVGQLWGTVQHQRAPRALVKGRIDPIKLSETALSTSDSAFVPVGRAPLPLDSSDISVTLDLDNRKKGLIWYSTYHVDFLGKYVISNPSDIDQFVVFEYSFPAEDGIYDGFAFKIDGDSVPKLDASGSTVSRELWLRAGERKTVEISYRSHGMDEWWYLLGSGVTQIQNFRLTMTTDFDEIDFPANSMSPVSMQRTGDGWTLIWEYDSLISGIQIGMDLPQKLNPGPFVSRLSFFAPVSLFFFFFVMFMVTTVRNIKIHFMNYFFLATAFFAFHLLLAYLVDHINVHWACVISSLVSVFLVLSYMRLVVGVRFALVETGLAQFVYLILFSYAFFLEGYTGLTITILAIVTLFLVMQFTARLDWDKQLAGEVPVTLRTD